MRFYLVNTVNTVVEVKGTQSERDDLLSRGWKLATPEQIAKFRLRYRKRNPDPIPDKQEIIGFNKNLLDVYFLCPSFSATGYGVYSQDLQRYLLRSGVMLNQEYHGQQIGLCYHYPYHLEKMQTPYKILYTMFESTKMPDDWGKYLKMANEVIVPSQFCADVMLEQFDIKATVIPHGYNADVFTHQKRTKDRPFTFLHYDAFKYRKGWDIVFKAFTSEFKPDEPVKLILKTTLPKTLPFHMYPNIEVIKKVQSRGEMLEMMQRSDCFVYPSRGEGYGLPPLETLATGMDVITVNKHGIAQYFDDEYFIEVEAGESKAKYDNPAFNGMDLGNYAEVDPVRLAEAMRKCYIDHKRNTTDISDKKSTWVKQHSMQNYAPMFADLFKNALELMPNSKTDIPKLSIIMLTHNALAYTKKALAAILKNTVNDYELIIIDNASTDDTQEWLKKVAAVKRDFNLRVVLNKENKGVAGGRNQGIDLARGHYVVFLDNDTEVGERWDDRILETMTVNPDVWVVGKAGSNVAALNPITWIPLDGSTDRVEADVVAGFCFAFPRKVIEYIGKQYEGMGKFWHEDLEFCLRVKKYGKKVIRDSGIPILHHEHKSAGNDVKGDAIKAVFGGFESKAKKVQNRLIDSNILTIYREPDNSHSSYSVIADNVDDYLRDLGLVVFRKQHLHSETKSFDLCKGFELNINGKRGVVLHLENDRPPRSWLKELELVDFVLCASDHVYLALQAYPELEGKLVNYSPDGFNHKVYHWEVEPYEQNPYGNPDAFTFIQVGAAQPRKGTDLLIEAFAQEFTPDEPVQLLVKNYDYGQQHYVDRFANKYPEANIITLYEDWSDEHLARVLKTLSKNGAYCSPHRGEGFGIPQLEAVACGMRIGYTNIGGCSTNLLDTLLLGTGETFGFEMQPSTFHNNSLEVYYEPDEQPHWAEPNLEDIKKWMRSVYSSKYDSKQAKLASRHITASFSFRNRASGVLNELRKIA